MPSLLIKNGHIIDPANNINEKADVLAIDDETSVEYIHRMGRQARKTHVYAMGAITKDRAGEQLSEMGFMLQAGAVGFTDDGSGVQNAAMMLKALKYASMFKNIVISQHCQDNSLAGA